MSKDERKHLALAYVAGPYRSSTIYGVKKNIERAGDVGDELWKLGIPNICPHRNSALSDGLVPDSYWLAGDIEMLLRCDLVVLVPGWENSSGTRAEKQVAEENFITVFEWPNDREDIMHFCEEMRMTPPPEPVSSPSIVDGYVTN